MSLVIIHYYNLFIYFTFRTFTIHITIKTTKKARDTQRILFGMIITDLTILSSPVCTTSCELGIHLTHETCVDDDKHHHHVDH